MPWNNADIAKDLAPSGLKFIERITFDVAPPLPPMYRDGEPQIRDGRVLTYSPATCRPEQGRFDNEAHEVVAVDDPDKVARINAGWLRMAQEYGLFDEHREFLFGLNIDDPDDNDGQGIWARVQLAEHWDLAGAGSSLLRSAFAAVMVTDDFIPEFTMISLDQKMILQTTVWGNGTVSTIVIRPDRLKA